MLRYIEVACILKSFFVFFILFYKYISMQIWNVAKTRIQKRCHTKHEMLIHTVDMKCTKAEINNWLFQNQVLWNLKQTIILGLIYPPMRQTWSLRVATTMQQPVLITTLWHLYLDY